MLQRPGLIPAAEGVEVGDLEDMDSMGNHIQLTVPTSSQGPIIGI